MNAIQPHTIPPGWKLTACARCSNPVLVRLSFNEGEDMECCPPCTHHVLTSDR